MLWIRWHDDPEQLGQDLAQAAHLLGLPESRLEEARTGRVALVDAVWEHLATVTPSSAVNNLANAQARLGEHQQAAELHQQNLADRERVLGPDHPDTLASRNNLANAQARLARTGRQRRWWQLSRRRREV
ncbi:tetratricopeptide repeat protein [Streptomyces californicus]|uniref:tetratricopeptide repeat protein n=1 Tax=Streptomyces californicus TaxID=67351 RepID=UPI00369ED0CC